MYPEEGAGNLLKAVSERFEKSKKMRFQVNSLKPGEEGESQVNQGLESFCCFLHFFGSLEDLL